MWQPTQQENGSWIVTNPEQRRTIILPTTKQPMTFPTREAAQAFADVQNAADRRHGSMQT